MAAVKAPELARFALLLGQLVGMVLQMNHWVHSLVKCAGGKVGPEKDNLPVAMNLAVGVSQELHDLDELLRDLTENLADVRKETNEQLAFSRCSRLNWRLQAIRALFGETNAEEMIAHAFKEHLGKVPAEDTVQSQLDQATAKLEAMLEQPTEETRNLRSIRV